MQVCEQAFETTKLPIILLLILVSTSKRTGQMLCLKRRKKEEERESRAQIITFTTNQFPLQEDRIF
jgi:hypothetical protein